MLQTRDSGLPLDVKAIGDDGSIEGYGSVFGVVDSYGEVVEPGAFVGSLAQRGRSSVKMLWQHDTTQPIGVWNELSEDKKGLHVKGQLLVDVSPRAAEAYGLLKASALDGLSIGYRNIETAPHPDKTGVVRLLKLDLKEVSIVTFGANDRARVDVVKSILDAGGKPTVRDVEGLLREAGFSKSLAAKGASMLEPLLRGEPEAQADDQAMQFLRALRG